MNIDINYELSHRIQSYAGKYVIGKDENIDALSK